jgi:hypothetical protein
MHTGTVKELHKSIVLENIDLTLQEFYILIKIMEKTGFANKISQKANVGAGRQSRVYQVKDSFLLNLNLK